MYFGVVYVCILNTKNLFSVNFELEIHIRFYFIFLHQREFWENIITKFQSHMDKCATIFGMDVVRALNNK